MKSKEEARELAKKYMEDNKPGYSMRSCWECNGAHEGLKEKEHPICCFGCGKWFYKGIDITENEE